ncbi:MAG: TIGR03663 family protein [Chloroflexota bacterium]|nr:TIGR03663 family protein [Chloroflexota bacterium]
MVTGNPTTVHSAHVDTLYAERRIRLSSASRVRGISVETLVWGILLILAVATRFWNLDYRTLHHDESLHTYYSWVFAAGETPYRHDPLMHGPFLFHANALVYFLFGASDATSRFLPAIAGVLLVGAPWLLRGSRFLGRWGALAAGFMLLISPSFLYYTRYIRHDPYTSLGAIVLCIAIFRYLEKPQRRWMLLAFVLVGFMFTNHEIVFAILLAFIGVLVGTLLLGALRPLIPVCLGTAGAAIMLLVARSLLDWRPFPEIPWEGPTPAQQSAFYRDLLSNPFVIGALLIGVLFIIASVWTMRASVRERAGDDGYFQAIFGHSPQGSLERGVLNALSDPIGLAIGSVAGLFIFFGLFTTMFTNLDGIASSTYATDGTLLYWLGQHDVRRGSQPWFYFITESFQYEWLAILLCTAASAMVLTRLAKAGLGRGVDRRLLFSVFLFAWFGFLFAVLSWAGEKMPWLIMHFLLPAILLGALLVDEIVIGAVAWYRTRRGGILGFSERQFGLGLLLALVLVAAAWFLEASRLTYGVYPSTNVGPGQREVTGWALDEWWLLAAIPLLGLLLVGLSAALAGVRRTAYITITAAVIVMSLYQVHAGFRLAFLEGDVARDTLIYNTTTPDIKQMDDELTELSYLAYGDNQLEIGYDGCAGWPLTWYFRDNPGARSISQTDIESGAGLPAILVGVPSAWDGSRSCFMPDEVDGYTSQTYILRWHEPESVIYRNFAIAPELNPASSAWGLDSNPHGISAIAESIWSSIMTQTTPEGEQRLFRLLFFRELPTGLNGYRYKIYVRNDLLPYYNDIRYGE